MNDLISGNLDTAYFDHPVMIIVHPDQGRMDLDDPKIIDGNSDIFLIAEAQKTPINCLNIVANGMTFKLTRECLPGIVDRSQVENLFATPIGLNSAAIGFTLGDHLVTGRHLMPINLMLLKIAQSIGQNLSATGIIWRPAGIHIGFDYFSEASYHYGRQGIFPLLSQIAVVEPSRKQIQTRGLNYFCGYEIRINFPSKGRRHDWIVHLLKLAQSAIRREKLAETNPLLNASPEKSKLASIQNVGRCLEINYSGGHSNRLKCPALAWKNFNQAAFGAASRTF
ncbi:MAG: hypothetical protein ABJZ79_09855 [Parasphingorhabdus sp.]